MEQLESELRSLGHMLAVREIYGENSSDYRRKRAEHNRLLRKLYQLQKKN